MQVLLTYYLLPYNVSPLFFIVGTFNSSLCLTSDHSLNLIHKSLGLHKQNMMHKIKNVCEQ